MAARMSVGRIAIVGLVLALLMIPVRSGAIEVKKEIYTRHGRARPAPRNPLTPALRTKLAQTVSYESEIYLSRESEKKAEGKPYVDLEDAKFVYLPSMSGGKVRVTARLEGAEYRPHQGDVESKGTPTGRRRALVFEYRLDGSRWIEVAPPKWRYLRPPPRGAAR